MKAKKRLERFLAAASAMLKPGYVYRMKTDNPVRVHRGIVYIVQDGKEPDALVLKCPCGCGNSIHLNLLKDTRPCWSFSIKEGKITISPSVRARGGCRSHFLIRDGKVVWV